MKYSAGFHFHTLSSSSGFILFALEPGSTHSTPPHHKPTIVHLQMLKIMNGSLNQRGEENGGRWIPLFYGNCWAM